MPHRQATSSRKPAPRAYLFNHLHCGCSGTSLGPAVYGPSHPVPVLGHCCLNCMHRILIYEGDQVTERLTPSKDFPYSRFLRWACYATQGHSEKHQYWSRGRGQGGEGEAGQGDWLRAGQFEQFRWASGYRGCPWLSGRWAWVVQGGRRWSGVSERDKEDSRSQARPKQLQPLV